jgi:regulator of sirC expression with transglutaminase-like and TPR domain
MNFTSAARHNFHTIIDQPESTINLAEAALYIAQEEYPALDVEEYLSALDAMSREVQERLEQRPILCRLFARSISIYMKI